MPSVKRTAGTLQVSYPPPGLSPDNPTVVPGGGGFCIWGQATDAGALGAVATWSGGGPVTGVPIPSGDANLAPCNFGFTFANVDTTQTKIVTITVSGTNVAPVAIQNLKMGAYGKVVGPRARGS
jgi:hypothetical protein